MNTRQGEVNVSGKQSCENSLGMAKNKLDPCGVTRAANGGSGVPLIKLFPKFRNN